MRDAISPSGPAGHLPINGGDAPSLFFGFDDFAAGARAVVVGVRADRVRPPHVLAVRASLDLDQREREVRAATSLLRLGELDLRQSHGPETLPEPSFSSPGLRFPRWPAGSPAAPPPHAPQPPSCAPARPR